jgi:hypothetical protein
MVDQKQPQSQRYRDAAFPIFILMASRRLNSDVLLCGGGVSSERDAMEKER